MLSLATVLSSLLLGSMLFFVGVVASSLHRTLEDEAALKLTRVLFPKFFLWGIILSASATILCIMSKSYIAILLLIILLGFVYSRQILMPKISLFKDKWLASDSPEDKTRYKSLHKRSVIIITTQILLLLAIVIATQILYPAKY